MKFKVGAYELEQRSLGVQSSFIIFNMGTGEIDRITNKAVECEDGYGMFATTYDEVAGFLEGTRKIEDAKVFYNPESRQYEIAKLEIEESNVDDRVHKLPSNEDADIRVILDHANTCWKVLLSPDFVASILEQKITVTEILTFSVTARGNPNILYRMIKVPLEDIIRQTYHILPFEHEFERNQEPVSLYTMKKFDSYSFEVNHE